MVRREFIFRIGLIAIVTVALISVGYADTVQVSDFETGFNGWGADAATLSLSSTTGSQAMLVEARSGWVNAAKLDMKSLKDVLGNNGVTITGDVTAYPDDMAIPGYFQVVMVINGDGIGWNNLDFVEITVDGETRTCTWTIPDSLAESIAAAPVSMGWFEIFLISNADVATKFYIDDIQLNGVPGGQEETPPKSTDMVIGDWEQQLDGWVVGSNADVLYSDVNGVTLGDYSLDVVVRSGEWNQELLILDLLEPNNAAILEAFKINTKITVDVTWLVANWPTGTEHGVDDLDWNELLLIIDAGGDEWATDWEQMVGSGNWSKGAFWLPRSGEDETISATWDYSQILADADFDNMTTCRIQIGINANDVDYTGWVWFYLDNMKLCGAGVAMNPQPADGARDVDRANQFTWDAGRYAASYDVYLGTDRGAVLAADGDSDPNVLFVTVDTNSFSPGVLEYGMQYFWRVDAVNDVNPDSPWAGNTCKFTTAKFDVVDNFETYTNNSPNQLFQAWCDSLGFLADDFFPDGKAGNGTGSLVGYDPRYFDIVETDNVHSGDQAFVMTYDNENTNISEAIRTWTEPQGWSCERMTLWTRGMVTNTTDRLYITLKDSTGTVETEVHPDASILTVVDWTEWVIPVGDFTNVNLSSIVEMTIGVGDASNPKASSGTLFVDDIRLYPRAVVHLEEDCLIIQPTSVAPVIDGVADAAWDSISETTMLISDMSNAASAAPEDAADLSASFKVMYDDTNFYFFVQVQDSVIDVTYSDYQGDGIEIYFDGDYSHGDTYDGVNDNQIRITVADVGLADIDSPLAVPGIEFKVLRTTGGYNIEAAVPLRELQIYPSDDPAPILDTAGNPIPGSDIAPNNVIGFEMQINDDDGGGRETLLRWYSDNNDSYRNPSLFGQARLIPAADGQ